MKHNKNRKYYNPTEMELLQQKLDKALDELESVKWEKNNADFVNDIVRKERDNCTLAIKYLTHIYLLFDGLNAAIANDYPLCTIFFEAITAFKRKINEGMVNIVSDGDNLWFEGINDELMGDKDEKKV